MNAALLAVGRRGASIAWQQALAPVAAASSSSAGSWGVCWAQQARSRQQQPFTSSSAAASGEPEQQQQQDDASSIGNEKVQRLADEIVGLTVLECSWLSEILRKRLNMERPAFGGMPMMPMMAAPGGAAGGAGAGGDAAPAAEEKKEQTEFAVKLEAFSAEGKIKVIKEIRAITSLGLKEAKELVEKAPVVVKSGLSKADAEAMLKQLEGAGGTVKLE
ncbi:hypothetical protein Rsub_13093 [Raphidocelis subcapitata]|uniref:Ribosomal protein L7/L12 C-terminal domain-containing protein n=1 Tax=Raphidocelis subcapitata TaxID=307507 RepID=A0A2V0PL41_9CHLO|nr:hypothetical protein Rsub_13093 [Raphidocelis subcapitata]|eukprot:GBG00437.1 hypothetical protein Rsub_13093 [Raphidocelis subcapitata]